MVRTQIQLTEEQAAALRELARREGRSVADLIRESVEVQLRAKGMADRAAMKRRALAAAGKFRSGRSDLSALHDEHAAGAFAE